MTNLQPEHRRAKRARRSQVLFWRGLGRVDLELGWLLEASPDGFAMAWRGAPAPSPGALIEVYHDPTDSERAVGRAVVRRAALAHDNLVVIGAEILTMGPFPPAAAASLDMKRWTLEQDALALSLAA